MSLSECRGDVQSGDPEQPYNIVNIASYVEGILRTLKPHDSGDQASPALQARSLLHKEYLSTRSEDTSRETVWNLHFANRQSIMPLTSSILFCKLKLMKLVSIITRYGGTRASLCCRNKDEATCVLFTNAA